MSEPLLQVDKIEVVYKRVITAVQGVTLSVAKRQIVALLGTNGAGKTTTLRAISGFLGIDDARVTEGTISFEGARLENLPPYDITGRGVVAGARAGEGFSQSHRRGKSFCVGCTRRYCRGTAA